MVNTIFRAVDSERQVWEDRINASFAKIRSFERVCNHADCTVTLGDNLCLTECDYCPAWNRYTRGSAPEIPPPVYFTDREPLLL
jgi:hypothetical protein